MKPSTLMIVLMMVPFVGWSQLHDSFSDGNFTTSPAWSGNTGQFVVEQGMLRLADDQAGQAYLATPNAMVGNTQWDFWVRIAFTPSSNNHPRIYLVSNIQQLDSLLNGYYIQVGKNGTDNKRLFFFRQDGDASVELLAGAGNIATGSNNILRIRVTRDSHGNWEFFADPSGDHLMIPQGEVFDDTYSTSSWFGISCRYTISNANRYWFDDFRIGDIVPDLEPLRVNRTRVMAANALEVSFSKIVEPESAQKVTNYFVNHDLGMPLVVAPDANRPDRVSLVFEKNFPQNQLLELHIVNVKDLAGNTMDPYIGTFVHHKPARFDVVFNELMVDPSPTVGLPPFEYIELVNNMAFPVNLQGWVLQHGDTRRDLPDHDIPAAGLVVLVADEALPSMQGYGQVIAVPELSSSALTNAGTSLLLFDPGGLLVSFVTYSDQWYADPAKVKGGWSLEKIDPHNHCQGKENWKASTSGAGGTPAKENSVQTGNPDAAAPDLLRAGYVDDQTITLFFSEPMDEGLLDNPENYRIMPLQEEHDWSWQPQAVHPQLPDFSKVIVGLQQPMKPGTHYQVMVQQLTDCAANGLGQQRVLAAVPEPAASLEVVINEILFHPAAGGARYIEFFNKSTKVVDLKDYLICSHDTVGQNFPSQISVSPESYLFFPDNWLVVTPDPDAVKRQFMTPNPHGFLKSDALPGMTTTQGILVLTSKSLEVIDRVVFHQEMHLPLLTNYRGVALERLNPSWPSSEASNWQSAAQSAGFGTPAYQNSQFILHQDTLADPVEVYPQVFSPDGDGHHDVLSISYGFQKAGLTANIRIFDSRGRMIRWLQQAALMATKGVVTWDGTTDEAAKAPMGIYIIHLEVYDVEGHVNHYRKSAVLGGKL